MFLWLEKPQDIWHPDPYFVGNGDRALKYIKPELCRENWSKLDACSGGILCGNNRESAQASSAVAVTIVEITIYTEMSNCIVIVTVIL